MIIKDTREDIYRGCTIKVRREAGVTVHHEIITKDGVVLGSGKGRDPDPNVVFDMLKLKVDSRVEDAGEDLEIWEKMQTGEIEI